MDCSLNREIFGTSIKLPDVRKTALEGRRYGWINDAGQLNGKSSNAVLGTVYEWRDTATEHEVTVHTKGPAA